MELSNYTHWEIVSYVQVFLFAILLVAFLVIHQLKERKGLRQILPFFIFFHNFPRIKNSRWYSWFGVYSSKTLMLVYLFLHSYLIQLVWVL